MRKLLVALLVLSASFTHAQNYQCLQGGVKHYFTNANGYLRGIRIDSVVTAGSNLIYYPFRTPRGTYMTGGISGGTLDSNGGSWLGKRVVQQSDGTFLFDNMWGDTVVIHTQAHTGDTWTFYNDTTAQYYRASVISEDTMTILGTADSVKTIRLTAYNASGINASDTLNNIMLTLSKNHGFAQVIDLYTFPYHATGAAYAMGKDFYLDRVSSEDSRPSKRTASFSLTVFSNPTIAELYDRNPGDVFEYSVYEPVWLPPSHIISSYYPYAYYFDSVTAKVLSADSVQYTYDGWLAHQYFAFEYLPYVHYTYDFTTTHSTPVFHSNHLIDTSKIPEEYLQTAIPYYFPEDTSYCMHSAIYRLDQNPIVGNEWVDIYFESSGTMRTYKIGLGLVQYYFYDAGNDAVYDTELIYYQKSGTACGSYLSPTPVAVENLSTSRPAINIYPNPASTQLQVSSSEKIRGVVVTTVLGQTIMHEQYDTRQATLDISALPAGVYFVRINDASVHRFVKQ